MIAICYGRDIDRWKLLNGRLQSMGFDSSQCGEAAFTLYQICDCCVSEIGEPSRKLFETELDHTLQFLYDRAFFPAAVRNE